MRSVCRTQLKKTALLVTAVVALSLLILAAGLWFLSRPVDITEQDAISGIPEALPQEVGYSQFAQPNFGMICLCANPTVEGKDIYLYLTNPAVNPHLLRAEVYTAVPKTNPSNGQVSWEPGQLLGKTGFLEPGTYVEKVTLSKALPDGENYLLVKAALRNAETGSSEGFVYLNMMVKK
jgi:hypothetical protein